ncbi:MAG: ABC transporter substrate-binding protein [Deltaproteobacteria bacterium]|nr:ABC transporter substrate-binding protein [Deltaproteobacteria bacterium]
MTRKFIFSALFFILALMFLPPAFASESNKKIFKLGIALPLSGGAAWMGDSAKKAVDLYFLKTPEAKERLEVIYEDVATNNIPQGISAVRSLIEIQKIDALILFVTPVAMAVANDIDRYQIPTITITGGNAAKGHNYIVNIWHSPNAEADAVYGEILKHPEWSSLGVITSEQESMIVRTQALMAAFERNTATKIIAINETLINESVIDLLAIKTKQKAPSAVILNLMPGQVSLLAKKLKEKHYSGQIIGCMTMADQREQEMAAGALNGALYVDSNLSDSFSSLYKNTYQTNPPPVSANTYDALSIIDDAVKKGLGQDREQLNTALRVKNFSGALGKFSFIDNGQNEFDLKAKMLKVPDMR